MATEDQSSAKLLQYAISVGDTDLAAAAAKELAHGRVILSARLQKQKRDADVSITENTIRVRVSIEKRESSKEIVLTLQPCVTFAALKALMRSKHEIPVERQRWIVGDRIAKDTESLIDCNVTVDNSLIFCYVASSDLQPVVNIEQYLYSLLTNYGTIPAKSRNSLSHLAENGEDEGPVSIGVQETNYAAPPTPKRSASHQPKASEPHPREHRMKSAPNISKLDTNQQPSADRHVVEHSDHSGPNLPAASGHSQSSPALRTVGGNGDSGSDVLHSVGSHVIAQASEEETELTKAAAATGGGWQCLKCTFINVPTRPGCEMCTAARPLDYKLPPHFSLSAREEARMMRERESEAEARKVAESMRRGTDAAEQRDYLDYLKALQAGGSDLVPNYEKVNCSICLKDVPIARGVILHKCQHCFCRKCLRDYIMNCMAAQIICPYRHGRTSCTKTILDSEIGKLVSTEEYAKYQRLCLALAESQEKASFHCRTVNCPGWCVFDDFVNSFLCRVCAKENCLVCKAQHEGKNCRQYQDDLKQRALTDMNADLTVRFLEQQIKNGDAMRCPRCAIYLGKKDGCDWLMCPMCRLQICWVTKGPRWGPQGEGDVSGGCKCRVGGKPCHPQCQDCH